jgi:tetratricopeptide (TPR) repeat protein
MRRILFTIALVTTTFIGQAQTNLDSLYSVWQDQTQTDSIRSAAYHDYIWKGFLFSNPDTAFVLAEDLVGFGQEKRYLNAQTEGYNIQGVSYAIRSNNNKALEYFHLGLKIHEETGNKNGMSSSLNNLGNIYISQSNYPKALANFHRSLKIFEEIGNKKGKANVLSNIGNIYESQSKLTKALEYYLRSLKIYEEIEDKMGIANVLGNIGLIYDSQGNNQKSMEYNQRCLKIFEEVGNKKGIANTLNNIGNIYYSQSKFTKAMENFQRCLKIYEEIGDINGIANALGNIGNIYKSQSKFPDALDYFQRCLKIYEELGDKNGIATSLFHIGNIYKSQNNYQEALNQCQNALEISEETGSLVGQKNACSCLYDTYKAMDKGNEALVYLEKISVLDDSLDAEETSKELQQMEFAKTMLQDSISKADEARVILESHQEEVSQKNRIRNYIAIAGILVLLLAGGIYGRLRYTRKAKNIIEQQKDIVETEKAKVEESHKDITDSIRYAKRIQSAILPPQKLVKEHLPNSFILYKPKDVVAGDFYWMEHKNDQVFFAAADCTGHGVPGAMVSVICVNGLNRSVREFGLSEPGEILDNTRKLVIKEFEKSEEEVQDGMDIALCALEGNKLKYAGANNPLWIIRNGKILETKGDKQPIGKYALEVPFVTHSLELQQGDTVYIFSDGYVDQFGGDYGKKFKAKALRELLLSVQSKTMEEQHSIIGEAFEDWRGDNEQIDDVCIFGVRI